VGSACACVGGEGGNASSDERGRSEFLLRWRGEEKRR